MVHSATDYTYSAGAAVVAISKAAVKAWGELLKEFNYCIKWVDVWYEGARTTRTIIFWQGWFIPCAMEKNRFLQIVHVKTLEYNRCLNIWMHCDVQHFLPFKKN